MPDDLPTLAFPDVPSFAAWLAEQHTTAPGLWLKIPKRGGNGAGPTYSQALDEALRFGWIDSQKAKLDDDYFLQRFTPRRARSRWSKVNRDRVEKLQKAGRMEPEGEREVAEAKADGRWAAAYDPPSTAEVPDDLQAALDAAPAALAFFESLTRSKRFMILYQVQDAKRAETRARRIKKYVEMCQRGESP